MTGIQVHQTWHRSGKKTAILITFSLLLGPRTTGETLDDFCSRLAGGNTYLKRVERLPDSMFFHQSVLLWLVETMNLQQPIQIAIPVRVTTRMIMSIGHFRRKRYWRRSMMQKSVVRHWAPRVDGVCSISQIRCSQSLAKEIREILAR